MPTRSLIIDLNILQILFQCFLQLLHPAPKILTPLCRLYHLKVNLLQQLQCLPNILLLLLDLNLQVILIRLYVINIILLQITQRVKYTLKPFLIFLHQVTNVLLGCFTLVLDLAQFDLHFLHLDL